MTRILIIEDEEKLASLLADYCRHAGFTASVCLRGAEGLALLQEQGADAVLLDLMLPDGDGLDICKAIRRNSNVPILITSARVDELDRLLGLELGADDYICKPFSPREVVARVRAQLRRAALAAAPEPDSTLGLHLDPAFHRATLGEVALDLTPVEFRLLRTLLSVPGAVFSRRQLMDAAYDDHRVVSERTMDSHLKNLRRKLEDAGARSGIEIPSIEGVYGVGYRLISA